MGTPLKHEDDGLSGSIRPVPIINISAMDSLAATSLREVNHEKMRSRVNSS